LPEKGKEVSSRSFLYLPLEVRAQKKGKKVYAGWGWGKEKGVNRIDVSCQSTVARSRKKGRKWDEDMANSQRRRRGERQRPGRTANLPTFIPGYLPMPIDAKKKEKKKRMTGRGREGKMTNIHGIPVGLFSFLPCPMMTPTTS